MNATERLYRSGQSLWLDNITRELITSGTLARYIGELAVKGLTSNPAIYDHALRQGAAYDAEIRERRGAGLSAERLFFELALQDLTAAADLFRETHERTSGVDGWVSLEVSPLLARDAASTLAEARELHARANRPNLYIKIPGTPEGLLAIEDAVFAGIPVNVTLLFSPAQYLAAADAWLRGIERRIEAGLSADVSSVASVFISRWDAAVATRAPKRLLGKLGLAIGRSVYRAYSGLLASSRWRRALNAGARPQRLLFASTGTKDPAASDIFYVKGLVAPLTVNTVPESTLRAFADHGELETGWIAGERESERVLEDFREAGIGLDEVAEHLQQDGAASFVNAWNDLLGVIAAKSSAAGPGPRARRVVA